MSTTQVAAKFLESQLAFTTDGENETVFSDNPVPGIGDVGRANLEECAITNAAQVVGWYLRLNGDDEKMEDFLVKNGCHKPSVVKEGSGTLAVLRQKAEQFVLPEPDAAGGAVAAAEGTTQVMANFMSKQLSWKDDLDSFPVPGIGAVGRQKLRESQFQIGNAVQLIGHYMILNGDDNEFVEFMVTECGLRKQEVTKDNGVLAAIKEKIATFCSK